MTTALIIRDDAQMSVGFTPQALEMKQSALDAAACVFRVASETENALAVTVQMEVHSALKLAEEARKAAKEPVLEFGRRIDDLAKRYKCELEAEEIRLAELVGNYQTAKLAQERAAESLRNSKLNQLEIERAANLSRAETHDARDEINSRFDEAAKAIAPVSLGNVKGQTVREDWDIEVTDIHALYTAAPQMVTLTPALSQIRMALDLGMKLPGVKAQRVVKAGVRTTKPRVKELV